MLTTALIPPNLPIRIHRAEQQDLPTLLAIIHAAYVDYEGKLTPPSGAHNETVLSLATKLTHGEGALAWQGNISVGSVLFEPRSQEIYLGRLAVPPAFRRRGIGALLVRYVEAQAVGKGYDRITLGVRLQLPENTAFYTRLGYDIVSYDSQPGFTEPTFMTMAKTLRPQQDG